MAYADNQNQALRVTSLFQTGDGGVVIGAGIHHANGHVADEHRQAVTTMANSALASADNIRHLYPDGNKGRLGLFLIKHKQNPMAETVCRKTAMLSKLQ